MHMTATLTKWYEEHGRHEIFAGGKKVKMEDETHSLLLRDDIVTTELQHDLDNLGIAKNAREEKKRARDAKAASGSGLPASATPVSSELPVIGQHRGPVKNDEAYNARMAAMYREVVLKEKPAQSQDGFIPLGALIKPAGATAPKAEIAEPVAGD
jgi:hypothetical protein